MRTLLRLASFASLFVLLMPKSTREIVIYTVLFAALCVLIARRKRLPEKLLHREFLFFDVLAAVVLSVNFYSSWMSSVTLVAAAESCGLPLSLILGVLSAAAGAVSVFALDALLGAVRESRAARYLVILCVVFLEYAQMLCSSLNTLDTLTVTGFFGLLKNLSFILIINLLVVLLVRKWKTALLVTGSLFTLWSVVNAYVILYHGSPLFLSELANTATALDAAAGYRFAIIYPVWICLAVFALELYLILFLLRGTPEPTGRRTTLIRAGALLLSLALLLGTFNFKETKLRHSWDVSIRNYGFSLCTVEDIVHMIHKYNEPEGYDSSVIREPEVDRTSYLDVRPDIILILNETFCDLDYYSDVQADRDYLAPFYDTEGAAFGHAAISGIGGGTNNSEFELLTSKSMYLLPMEAPFNYIDFTVGQPSSIVQYAKSLGYTTTALHWCGTCYSRHEAFPAMGFDRIVMGEDKLTNELNGSRIVNDAGTYRDLIECYEEKKGEPQLFYLLTYQNHGGYEQNPPELDTVHTTRDFGDLTDDVDEYLSSLALSAEAFRELTEYFSSSDRPVIVCMVGDHGPSLISQLPANRKMSEEEKTIAMRTVPYAIWTNYGAELSDCPEYVTMTDLVPTVLKVAGLPLSPFYQSILDLNQLVPIRTSTGMLVTADGGIAPFDPAHPYYDAVQQYLFMEYNALKGGDDYREELFVPTIG